LPQLADHSLAQVKLLARAAARVRSTDALLDLQTSHVAVAAAWSKEGGRAYSRMQKRLTDHG
jgi:DNA recombination-dependent growth factor C